MWGVGGTERYWEDKKEKNGGEMGIKTEKDSSNDVDGSSGDIFF